MIASLLLIALVACGVWALAVHVRALSPSSQAIRACDEFTGSAVTHNGGGISVHQRQELLTSGATDAQQAAAADHTYSELAIHLTALGQLSKAARYEPLIGDTQAAQLSSQLVNDCRNAGQAP